MTEPWKERHHYKDKSLLPGAHHCGSCDAFKDGYCQMFDAVVGKQKVCDAWTSDFKEHDFQGKESARMTAMAQPLAPAQIPELTQHVEQLATQYGIDITWGGGNAWAGMGDITTPPIRTDYDYLTALHEIGHIAAHQADRGETQGLHGMGLSNGSQDWEWQDHEPPLHSGEQDIEDEAAVWRWAAAQSRIPVTQDMWSDVLKDAQTYHDAETAEPWYTPADVPDYPRTGPHWDWLQQQRTAGASGPLPELTFDDEPLGSSKEHLVNAYADGLKVGYVNLLAYPNEAYIIKVWVRPEWRRRGVATAVVQEAERLYPSLQHASNFTDEGRQFYESLEPGTEWEPAEGGTWDRQAKTAASQVMRPGHRVLWNGVGHTITNAGQNDVHNQLNPHLMPPEGHYQLRPDRPTEKPNDYANDRVTAPIHELTRLPDYQAGDRVSGSSDDNPYWHGTIVRVDNKDERAKAITDALNEQGAQEPYDPTLWIRYDHHGLRPNHPAAVRMLESGGAMPQDPEQMPDTVPWGEAEQDYYRKASAPRSWWHLTDKPNFALDPNYYPQNNTTLGGDWHEPGLMVSARPDSWYKGHDYVRPYVAEIEGEANDMGGYSGEHFIPASQFGQTRIKRVIPYSGWEGEEFEDKPYAGPDVREFTPEQHQEHLQLANDYIRNNRPHMLSFPCSHCGAEGEQWNECQSCGQKEVPGDDPYWQRGYMPQFKGKGGDFFKTAMALDPQDLERHIQRHGPYLYHSTLERNRDSIQRQGLHPAGDPEQAADWQPASAPRPGAVYLSTYPLDGWGNTHFRVDMRKLDPAKFDADEDHLPRPDLGRDAPVPRTPAWKGREDELEDPGWAEHSLGKGSIAYMGHIPPEALELLDSGAASDPEHNTWWETKKPQDSEMRCTFCNDLITPEVEGTKVICPHCGTWIRDAHESHLAYVPHVPSEAPRIDPNGFAELRKGMTFMRGSSALESLTENVQRALTPDLLQKGYAPGQHCYVAAEALYHILGGKAAGYKPMQMELPNGVSHWWLEGPEGVIDPTHGQFEGTLPDYVKGRGRGFLTVHPSRRAQIVIDRVRGTHSAAQSGADRDGAMVALSLSPEAAGKLHVEGGEPAEDLHITLAYFADKAADLSKESRDEIARILGNVAHETAAMEGTVGGVGRFDGAADKDAEPFIGTVDLPGLAEFHIKLKDEFRAAGFLLNEEHGFNPHVTLKYLDKDEDYPEVKTPVEIAFDTVTLVVGGKRSDFKLEGELVKTSDWEDAKHPRDTGGRFSVKHDQHEVKVQDEAGKHLHTLKRCRHCGVLYKRPAKHEGRIACPTCGEDPERNLRRTKVGAEPQAVADSLGWTYWKTNSNGHRMYQWTDEAGNPHIVTGNGRHGQGHEDQDTNGLFTRKNMRSCMAGTCNHAFLPGAQVVDEPGAPVLRAGQEVAYGGNRFWVITVDGDLAHIHNQSGEDIVPVAELQKTADAEQQQKNQDFLDDIEEKSKPRRDPDFAFVYFQGKLQIEAWTENVRYRYMADTLIKEMGFLGLGDYEEFDNDSTSAWVAGNVWKSHALRFEIKQLADAEVIEEAKEAVKEYLESGQEDWQWNPYDRED